MKTDLKCAMLSEQSRMFFRRLELPQRQQAQQCFVLLRCAALSLSFCVPIKPTEVHNNIIINGYYLQGSFISEVIYGVHTPISFLTKRQA